MKCTCTHRKPTKKDVLGKRERERERLPVTYLVLTSQTVTRETAVAVAMAVAAQLILFIERLLVDLFIYFFIVHHHITSFTHTVFIASRAWSLSFLFFFFIVWRLLFYFRPIIYSLLLYGCCCSCFCFCCKLTNFSTSIHAFNEFCNLNDRNSEIYSLIRHLQFAMRLIQSWMNWFVNRQCAAEFI